MKVISFAIQKGGTGKTTTAVMLSALLANHGHRVLLIDLDPQANATECLMDPVNVRASIRDVILSGVNITSVIQTSPEVRNLDFVPATPSMLIDEYFGRFSGILPHMLKNELNKLKREKGEEYYKYVMCDCPPNLLHFTKNALFTSDYVIIPLEPEPLALDGLLRLNADILPDIQKQNPSLRIGGVILIHRSQRTRRYMPERVRNDVDTILPGLRFRVEIPLDQYLALMREYSQPATVFAPRSPGCIYYEALLDEFLLRIPP